MLSAPAQHVMAAASPADASAAPDRQSNHYIGLDALRGVAAIGVVWYHFSERLALPDLVARGYLAVDFFFVLSGFVIARAYNARLASGSLPIGQFYLMRLIRLLPLVILGTLVAASIEWGRPDIVDRVRHLTETMVALVLGSALVPILWRTTLEQVIFPLNGPVWSLFFEAVANAGFAPVARMRAGKLLLPPLLAISGIALLIAGHQFGKLEVGSNVGSFWWGFPRVAWSFSIGVALFSWRARAPRLPFAMPALGLAILLCIPDLGEWNAAFDELAVLVMLPALVFAASTARFGRSGQALAAVSGDLSYPVYAIHYPIVRAIGFVGLRLHLAASGRLGLVLVSTVLIVVAAALVYAVYDRPMRRWLTGRLIARRLVRFPAPSLTAAVSDKKRC